MIQFLHNVRRLALGFVLLAGISSCSDFLERPPEDNYSDNDFYYTNDQVNSRIAPLYYKPWWNMFSTSFWPMTETISGNMFNYTHLSFTQFTVTSSNSMLEDTWGSLYSVVTQSNELINNLDDRAGGEVDQETIDIVKGEAYFLRAVAYFYLVRFWEEVPIIENTYVYIYSPQVPKNPKEDVYRFIEMDLAMAIDLLPEKIRGADYASNKRVSVGSAKSILAKVYLSQEKFAEAKNLAAEVINSGEFQLLDNYADLFLTDNNNNEESIFAIQWTISTDYGSGNQSNIANSASGYGLGNIGDWNVFGPSQDIQDIYPNGDLREVENIMVPGYTYENLYTSSGEQFTVPEDIDAATSGSAIKKYVVGGDDPYDNWGMTSNNTYVMRYADLLMIYAEAAMAGTGATSDATALMYFNMIRQRAGLVELPSITNETLLEERRREFAFEGEYWFDIQRLLSTSDAIELLNSQNRGDKNFDQFYTATAEDLIYPIPANESASNPLLLEEAVPYDFED
ncbi:RagB/SusD family nutrient uptake outer membrane protein [Zunongwangia sp. HRR-M8]|uniref:RagB/SusD family nutrient uptake outer membrane protein n=1 Tax=Zunongwangia sp. HRR-M8 TaxID=3015170 RepID=UPI0022DE4BFB|nr:RagB/SusD family nutrient uptake outer membrane protein [Zunongwangia sp. HRR-M8]WBL23110.1 RagB/SusD family nutrient uptake outer membrane protein [Zunongwangia sp. HRR-M8]